MRADAERNNARILQAARELVRARGADISMDEIAAAAGVAVGTLYRHHPTKAALLEAVVADSLGEWAAQAEAAAAQVAAGADAGTLLADLVRSITARYAEDRTVKTAAAALGARVPDPSGPFPPDGVEQRIFTAVDSVLGSAQRSGAVREDFTVADLVLLIGGVPEGTADARRYAELILTGIVGR